MKLFFNTSIVAVRAILFAATFFGFHPGVSLAADAEKPRHPATQLFINNHRYGDTNGCGTSPLGTTGSSTCGHAGHVSVVDWTFLRRTSQGDVYKLTRKYPSDSPNPGIETKEVTYAGKPIVVWKDDFQKIIIRPIPKPG